MPSPSRDLHCAVFSGKGVSGKPTRCLGNRRRPFPFFSLSHPSHVSNRRAEEGRRRLLQRRFHDRPSCFDDVLQFFQLRVPKLITIPVLHFTGERKNLASKECLTERRYVLYEELLKLSGWGCDPKTQSPIPGYGGAWDEALRVNSRFSMIKRKPFPLYDQMQMLCKNSTCTGEQAEGPPRMGKRRNVRERSPSSPHLHMNDDDFVIPPPPSVVNDVTPDFSQEDLNYMMSFSAGQHTESIRNEGSPMTPNIPTSNEQGTSRRKGVGNKGKGKMREKDVGSAALQMIAEASRERNGN
ncbi:hypothetical protein Taro_054413 [Colocasia esculenta]|uniref:Uncharacterized protein n=1 Tax=Colocasia esculenta TaxID=4460 RepID=A0A843XNM2_COLES|nr:hypothetical protein [Colocasia esculenta]